MGLADLMWQAREPWHTTWTPADINDPRFGVTANPIDSDLFWMEQAVLYAKGARGLGEIPFSCVVVRGEGECLSIAWGTGTANPVVHSELQAITQACSREDISAPTWLRGCTLFSSHEPCSMCCGGINHAKLSRVVFGSYRKDLPHLFRAGISSKELLANTSHPPEVVGGVRRHECTQLFKAVMKWD